MLASSFFAATVIFLALGFYLLDQLRFLIPYKNLILAAYGAKIALFAAILSLISLQDSSLSPGDSS